MEFAVRVILVGRTGLDAKLRLDPTIELVRVKSPLEAIGELSDPIEGYSPSRAVVIVGVDIYSDLAPTEPANESAADFTLRGTAAIDFARALRLVDPHVRILRVVMGSPGSTPTNTPAELSGTEPYYDGVIDADLSAEVLRQTVHRPRPNGGRPTGAGTPDDPGLGSFTGVPAAPAGHGAPKMPTTQPPPHGDPANPADDPILGTGGSTEPVEVLPRGEDARPDSEIGDAELVRLSLRGGDLLASAMRILRLRLDDPGAALLETIGPSGPVGENAEPGAARVECDGSKFGYLVSSRAEGAILEAHASWLGGWLRLAQQQSQLREAAFTDPLTGAWNRRYFDKFLSTAIDRARTGRQSVTLMLFDIDNFKRYNDRYGHAAADEILIETVRLLRSTIRPSDRVCRIGGDEFAVIFHEPAGPRVPGSTPPSSVFSITRRFQEQVRERKFPKLGIDAPGTLTISGGLATFPWDGTSVGDLLRRADELAMESKRSGKNAIMFGPGAGRDGAGE